ncbi:flagellar hook-associated protein FlgK [Stutzerimonas urumqiensis]|uniref:flagellar hook-associated protein FlgK n=1 Tax=Stutzerimonas urumqiensis TaxID=638269 RepID=UPI003DA4F7B9
MSTLTQIGYSGVRASQIALTASGQNVANVNTPGFSRLAPDLRSVASLGGVGVGGGVQVSDVRRLASDFQNQQLWRATTEQRYHDTSQQYLGALEGLLGSEGSSISGGLDNFFAALSEASSTPESIALRQQILGEAKQLAQRFNSLNSNIGVQLNALHGQRTAMVKEINGLTENIAALNKQITEMQSAGRETATLEDYRDNLLKELGGHAGIRVQAANDGSLTVSLANGQPLVAGASAGQLKVALNAAGEQEVSLLFARTTFPLVQDGLGGNLGALHDMEYGALRPARQDLHDMASALADKVNATLTAGFDRNGNPGQPLFVHDATSVSGMLTVADLAPEALAFSDTAGEMGNNGVLLKLLDIKGQPALVNGSLVPLNDGYAGLVGRVASASRQNQADLSAATTVTEQAQAQRDSISAVNLDEEAVNLMTYQQAYQANMKVISTSNALFDAVLAMF